MQQFYKQVINEQLIISRYKLMPKLIICRHESSLSKRNPMHINKKTGKKES